MTDSGTSVRPTRRQEAVAHAADLLRSGGPRALTSVAVAERMGITQSAIYRHVRNMDELAALAAEEVVAELNRSLHEILFDPAMDWEAIDDVKWLCRSLIEQVVRHQTSFEVVARFRFVDGPLGEGIRRIIAEGCDLVALLLETRWRSEFGGDTSLGKRELSALRAHAVAIHDDGHAVARLTYSPTLAPLDLDDVAVILQHRIIAGWASFVIDVNERVDLPFPQIDLAEGIVPK